MASKRHIGKRGRRPKSGPGAAPRYSPTELAVHFGVTENAIKSAMARGRLTPDADGLFDPEVAKREWLLKRQMAPGPGRPRKDRGPVGDAGQKHETLIEVQTRHELVKVAERELKLAKARAEVVDRKGVEKRIFELVRAQRERFLNWPADAAPRIAAALEVDPVQVEVALEREVRKLLEASTAEGLLAAPTGERAA